MELGQRIKELRIERGLTQKELAEPRYASAYVSSIESGRRTPSKVALEHFADRLGVSAQELSTGRSPARHAELLGEYGIARKLLASLESDAVEQADERFTRLVDTARREGLPDIEAKALTGRAIYAETRNDLDRALKAYDEALVLLRDDSPVVRVDAVVGKARVLQTKGDVAYAAFLIEKALAELADQDIKDPSSSLRLHTSLVAAYFDYGLTERANEAAETALGLALWVQDPDRLANLNLNVGIMLAQQGHWREAEIRLAEAERWFDQLRYETDLARVRLVRGINLRNQERFDDARPHLEAARVTFAASGNALREARATVALGVLERSAGRSDHAIFLLKQAITIAGDDEGVAGIAHRELALCHAESDKTQAIESLRTAIALLEQSGIARELAAAYRALGDLLSQDADMASACEAYRMAADLFEQAA